MRSDGLTITVTKDMTTTRRISPSDDVGTSANLAVELLVGVVAPGLPPDGLPERGKRPACRCGLIEWAATAGSLSVSASRTLTSWSIKPPGESAKAGTGLGFGAGCPTIQKWATPVPSASPSVASSRRADVAKARIRSFPTPQPAQRIGQRGWDAAASATSASSLLPACDTTLVPSGVAVILGRVVGTCTYGVHSSLAGSGSSASPESQARQAFPCVQASYRHQHDQIVPATSRFGHYEAQLRHATLV